MPSIHQGGTEKCARGCVAAGEVHLQGLLNFQVSEKEGLGEGTREETTFATFSMNLL